jgi:CheY-like chemotaxis protein
VESALRQAQRLEAVGQLTSGVAHDFNNLLMVVLGNIRQMQKAHLEPATQRRLQMMAQAAERGAQLTAQMLAFSRRQRLEPRPVDLNGTVLSMRDLLQSTMGGSIQIRTALQAELWPAMIDPTQIELMILNLAINARDAMEVGGALTVETGNVTLGPPTRPEEAPAGDYVMVAVSDTGSGMSEEVLDKVFEPFFTTKAVGKGSGLGLSQVFGLAKQSGGGVRIESSVGRGTSVQVFLPRAAATPEVRVTASVPPPVSTPKNVHVLLVDDDSAVREVTAGILHDLGYGVIEAGSGGAALDLLDREAEIDLLLLDFAMPGMNGAEVAREVHARRPGLPILFVTGYADTEVLAAAGDGGILRKPFVEKDLAAKVRSALRADPT